MPTPSTRASSSTDPVDLAEHLISVTGRVRRTLRDRSGQGGDASLNLSMSQEAVVGHLHRGGPRSTADLARLEGVRPQSMGLTIAALDELGLVTKTPDPADARRSLVDVTEAGRAMRASTRSHRVDVLARRLADLLEPADLATVERALGLLDRAIPGVVDGDDAPGSTTTTTGAVSGTPESK
ncbi:MarR family winged helix-turn-helix transcriptional regulator [Frigoribacterium sp. 2-23]|uniref:MarR family winged helix-turn-helix transcriptional regulator n=1 Tax=Frigoribacterium sp. 2-23 TaxID=3415006 RepID=UPI003C6F15FA